jgi:hypothetical protein
MKNEKLKMQNGERRNLQFFIFNFSFFILPFPGFGRNV